MFVITLGDILDLFMLLVVVIGFGVVAVLEHFGKGK